MIKRVIYLVENTFTQRDASRFGVEAMRNFGFDVEVWDATPVIFPKVYANYVPDDSVMLDSHRIFTNKKGLIQSLEGLGPEAFVVVIYGYKLQNMFTYRALSRSRAKYGIQSCLVTPIPAHGNPVSFFKKLYSILYQNPLLFTAQLVFQNIPYTWLGVRHPDLILAGGRRSYLYTKLYNSVSEAVWAHTLDYDLYLGLEASGRRRMLEGAYAVFIDGYVPFHPDDYAMGMSQEQYAEHYFRRLRKYLDQAERETGLPVVIAAHPRSQYEKMPEYFGGRTRIKGNTVELVRDARLVLLHGSTSVNFAALYRRPMVFLSTAYMEKRFTGLTLKAIAAEFGKLPVNIDMDVAVDFSREIRAVDEGIYKAYIENYIKTSGSEQKPFWEIVGERLRRFP